MTDPAAPIDAVVYDYVVTRAGDRPVCLVNVNANGRDVQVPGVFAPHQPTTRISHLWAAAVDLSPGQQVAMRFVQTDGLLWGPEETVRPDIDAQVGLRSLMIHETDASIAEHLRPFVTEGVELGGDFLQRFKVLLDGVNNVTLVVNPAA